MDGSNISSNISENRDSSDSSDNSDNSDSSDHKNSYLQQKTLFSPKKKIPKKMYKQFHNLFSTDFVFVKDKGTVKVAAKPKSFLHQKKVCHQKLFFNLQT